MSAPRPLDFSIAAGHVGAPRKYERLKESSEEGGSQRTVPLEVGKDECRVTIAGAGISFVVCIHASMYQLHELVSQQKDCSQSHHKVCANGAILSEATWRDGGAEVGEDARSRSLESYGLTGGSRVLVFCTKVSVQEEMKKMAEESSKFNGVRSFAQEEEIMRRRANAPAMFAKRASGSLADFRYGFGRCVPLQVDPNTGWRYSSPPPAAAEELLKRLASDRGILEIMRKNSWRVPTLTEIPPSPETGLVGASDHCLLGLNKNKGEEILLRLRTSDLKGFRPYYSIRETLVHELTHMVHSEHDDKFWSLFRVLMEESKELDWTQGNGQQVGGPARPEDAAGAAQPEVGRRLGGGAGGEEERQVRGSVAHVPARALAAAAASERMQDSRPSEPQQPSMLGLTLTDKDETREPETATEPAPEGQRMQESAGDELGESSRGDEEMGEAPDPLEELQMMGFSAEQAQQALSKFHGSLVRAADWLLAGSWDEGAADDARQQASGVGAQLPAEGPDEFQELRERVGNTVQRFVSSLEARPEAARVALETVLGIFRRITDSPSEQKFRKIRISNQTFQHKVASHAGGRELLLSANFRYSGEDSLEYQHEDIVPLLVASSVLEVALQFLP